MNIKLDRSAIYFGSLEKWLYWKHCSEFELGFGPDSFPCWGWPVRTIYNPEGKDEQVWAFVYPENDNNE